MLSTKLCKTCQCDKAGTSWQGQARVKCCNCRCHTHTRHMPHLAHAVRPGHAHLLCWVSPLQTRVCHSLQNCPNNNCKVANKLPHTHRLLSRSLSPLLCSTSLFPSLAISFPLCLPTKCALKIICLCLMCEIEIVECVESVPREASSLLSPSLSPLTLCPRLTV